MRVHAELLDGRGDPGALRAATVREREAVNQLTRAAHGLLSEKGHELSAATLERVSETLHAAARKQQARDLRVSAPARVSCSPAPISGPRQTRRGDRQAAFALPATNRPGSQSDRRNASGRAVAFVAYASPPSMRSYLLRVLARVRV